MPEGKHGSFTDFVELRVAWLFESEISRAEDDSIVRVGSFFPLLRGKETLPDCIQERTLFANFQYGENVPEAVL